MADKQSGAEPTQTTRTGAEIPIPTRDAFLRDLRKVAPPVEPAEGQANETRPSGPDTHRSDRP